MKKLYAALVLCLLSTGLIAQPYCNEWINFSSNQPYSNQQYFKVSVWKNGVYRITPTDLANAGFPANFNPKQFQLFHEGVEQFIHVEGEADNSFDPNDYIEFYGKKNDGSLDTRMYRFPDHQLNPRFSLFTDTAAYFLTLNSNPLVVNRRMVLETDVNFIGYTPHSYFMRNAFKDFTQQYVASNFSLIIDPGYDEGEGWTSAEWSGTYSPSLSVPNVSSDPTAPLAVARTILMGANNDGNTHSATVDVNGAISSTTFFGFAVNKFTIPVLSNASLGSTATFNFNVTGGVNLNTVPFINVNYPHSFSFLNENDPFYEMNILGGFSPGKSYIEITNLSMPNPKLYMYSGDTLKRITMVNGGSAWQALVPTYGSDKLCILTDSIYTAANNFLKIEPITTDPARFARFINYQYISQGNYLIVSHKSLWNKANEYLNYRSLSGFIPLLADIDELYNQFSYGIVKHPLSIRHFVDFAIDTFTVKPEYLFLLGKSVVPTRIRFNGANWNKTLVPTYGYPPSDNIIVSALNDTIMIPAVGVGRLSAQNDADIDAYLDKIMVHEQQQLQPPPKAWMKEVLHFGGGSNEYQGQVFKAILEDWENIIEDSLFGGNVTTFLKTSSDPIQVNQTEYLQNLIDSGVSIMSFLAHASGTTFDISTDIPQNYNNKDRYPLIIANSCFVGDIHTPLRLISEDFLMLPDKGAIGFIAEPSVGYPDNLSVYTHNLYKQIALHNYSGTIGKSIKFTVDSVITNPVYSSNYYLHYVYKSVCMGMTLQGDPALRLSFAQKQDYEITNASVYFTPSVVTTEIDSFDVNVIIKNLGIAKNESFTVHLTRNFPNNAGTYEKDTVLSFIPFKDTLTVRMAVDPIRGVGPNTFDVFVDYPNVIDEYREDNNIAQNVPLIIQSTDIIPVYPFEFSIVPNGTCTLKASTANPFSPVKPYAFQIDTTDQFSSPFLQQTVVNSPGGVVKWPLPFNLQPDLVYYWRVSRDSMPTDTIHPRWKESSFIHKPNISGWSQAHYSQFKKDLYTNVVYSNTIDSTFTFVSSPSTLLARNYQSPNQFYNPSYEINNVVQDYQMCGGTPSVHIAVIDPLTLKPWTTCNRNYGQANTFDCTTLQGQCRDREELYFIFRMNDSVSRNSMRILLEDTIPIGHYVLAYTVFNGLFSQWEPALMNVFTSWGADSIDDLQDGQPYIFFTKKGDNSYTQESIGDSTETFISLSVNLGGNWTKGFVNSVVIGPSVQWNELHWEQFPIEATSGADSIAIDILGIQPNGQEVPIPGFTGIQVTAPDLNINGIDATQYPKLRLRAYVQDEVLTTPPQLKRWQIYYQEVPELALNPSKHFKINKDTLDEGESFTMEMAIENIGNVNADSLLVDFYFYDADRVFHQLPKPRYKPTAPGDTIIAKTFVSSAGFPGMNSLWIDANPDDDQPEKYHFNNIAEIRFQVDKDITNPILDVTFDGIHILDGDIVSGKPNILVQLKDENKYLALNDTSDWQVFLKDPDGNQRKLAFEPLQCAGTGQEFMKWCPANLPDNTFKIEFRPTLLKDGIYELWVQATDMSENLSGDHSYKITFEVINRSTITEVINYPNPFSTSTRFVFTLTGSQVPEYFKIQIMTVTGKIIREITRDELGPIHIGRNITEYAWNGKDEYGDQLANGVYLYRVLTLLNGSAIEKRSTEADKFFTKGWGKMYLMR